MAAWPGIDETLVALARFHSALEHAVGRSDTDVRIGACRREHYVFTRRDLLSVLDYLAGDTEAKDADLRTALLRYYVGRVAPGEDQALLAQLLDAAGIGPSTWELDTAGPADAASARGPKPQAADGPSKSGSPDGAKPPPKDGGSGSPKPRSRRSRRSGRRGGGGRRRR